MLIEAFCSVTIIVMNYPLLLGLCTSLVCGSSVPDVKTYDGHKEYQVTGAKMDLDHFEATFKELDDHFLYNRYSHTSLQTIVSPQMVPYFEEIVKKTNLQATQVFNDLAQIIRLEKDTPLRSKQFSWSSYYDIDDIYGYVQNMSATYPEWTELVIGGESYEGRQIKGLRINTPEGRDDKPAMFIESGIHAREWIAPATTTYFINQLLTSENPDIVALRNQFDWHIFPSANPDGYHYSYTVDRMWRKTRSKSPNGCYGVDPNRNWDYNWLSKQIAKPFFVASAPLVTQQGASNDSCDDIYGGLKPFSEIETRTLAAYISGVENLLGYIAFHSYGQLLLVPYSDSVDHCDNYDDLVTIGKKSLEYAYKVNGAKYDGPATAAEVLYKASGVSMDWVRFALRTPLAFTYELGGSSFYWPPELIYQQGDEVTQMMVGLAQGSKDLGYIK